MNQLKTFIITIIAIATLLPLSLKADGAGSHVQRYELKVNDFEELNVVDGLNVEYRCSSDSAGLVTFVSTSDMASMLMFTPKKNKLKIQINTPASDEPIIGLPTVVVYSSLLKKVENSGDSLVRVISPFAPDKFKAKVIGNGLISVHGITSPDVSLSVITGKGQIVASGKCDLLSCSLTGTGTIQADRLEAVEASCKIVGTGTIGCYATGRVAIFGMGTGKVYYTGNPAKLDCKSLGIKAINLDEQ